MEKLYYKSERTKSYWESYNQPVHHPSIVCCGRPTVVVKYSSGGFIKHLCVSCQNTWKLSYNDFLQIKLEVYCPQCKIRMEPKKLRINGNYGFVCRSCKTAVQLADIVQEIKVYTNGYSPSPVSQNKKINSVVAQNIPDPTVISLCIKCKHFNQSSCTGPNKTRGSYERGGYQCSQFSRKDPVDFGW